MTLKEIYARCAQRGECKIWKGALSANGYPYIHDPEKHARTKKATGRGGSCRSGRRVVWKLKHGKEASGTVILTCGNKLCLNPAHMVDGTRSDVQRLASATGRLQTLARKVACAVNVQRNAKLSPEKAEAIRVVLAPMKGYKNPARRRAMEELASMYGVSYTAINDVRLGKRWAKPAVMPNSSVWAMNDSIMRAAA